jgi:peptide subunit release factor RF-3
VPADIAEEIELARGGYPEFDLEAYRHGDMTPVYFGSALKNFGVAELIDAIAKYAPPPRPQPSDQGTILPDNKEVTGFIFKVQANMDPQHRDRIAFMRLVSGTFKRGMKLTPSGWASRSRSIRRSCFSRRTARLPTAPSRAISSASPTTARCGWAIRCPNSTRSASPACPTSRPKSCAASS